VDGRRDQRVKVYVAASFQQGINVKEICEIIAKVGIFQTEMWWKHRDPIDYINFGITEVCFVTDPDSEPMFCFEAKKPKSCIDQYRVKLQEFFIALVSELAC